MNLLKALLAVGLTCTLSLLVSSPARAVDHPWDDNTVDSTHIAGTQPNAVNDAQVVTPTVIQRLTTWVNTIIRDVRSFVKGTKHGGGAISSKPESRKLQQSFRNKKFK